jgi:hypothetical protein
MVIPNDHDWQPGMPAALIRNWSKQKLIDAVGLHVDNIWINMHKCVMKPKNYILMDQFNVKQNMWQKSR